MYDHELVVALIDKAGKNFKSQAELARALGAMPQHVTNWKNKTRKASPVEIAALAELAGLDAIKFLAKAQLDELEGSKKGQVLARALGKFALATGGALAGVSAHASPVFELIRYVLC